MVSVINAVNTVFIHIIGSQIKRHIAVKMIWRVSGDGCARSSAWIYTWTAMLLFWNWLCAYILLFFTCCFDSYHNMVLTSTSFLSVFETIEFVQFLNVAHITTITFSRNPLHRRIMREREHANTWASERTSEVMTKKRKKDDTVKNMHFTLDNNRNTKLQMLQLTENLQSSFSNWFWA